MSLIEVKKSIQDSNSLRMAILDYLDKSGEPLIVKVSAISGILAQVFSEHCIESGKCPETLTEKVFSSLKSDIIRVVNMENSGDIA